jgi:DNA-binding NarL/FixJ family response regulator
MSIGVLVVDDQPEVRSALCTLLRRSADITVLGEAADGARAVSLVEELSPDVVLMDVRMPLLDGISATRALRTSDLTSSVRVIVLTAFDLDEYVFAALREGAAGFLTKNVAPHDLRQAVRVVADGQALLDPAITRRVIERFAPIRRDRLAALTPREREIARLIAAGLTNREIAQQLVVSIWTVKTHVAHILAKLGVQERAQVVIAVYESGEIVPGGE